MLPFAPAFPAPSGFSLPRSTADHSSEAVLRETLEWSGGLRRIPGAGQNTPDPIDAGDLPGREAPAYLIEGMPLGPSGYPGTVPDPVAPVWLDKVSYLPADPLVLPSNPSGGAMVELDLMRPDSSRTLSAARLTSGSGGVYTEEFFLARPTGSHLIRLGYADSKTEGRFGIGYFQQFGENLLARIDRGTSWGGYRLGWGRSMTRVRPSFDQRYLNDRSTLEGGAALRRQAWAADLSLLVSWERLAWEGAVPASRKEALIRGLLRIRGEGANWRPLLTLQLDRQRRRFFQPAWPAIAEDRTRLGPGLACGVEGASGSWRLRTSAGLSTPAPEKSGWVAAASVERPLPRGWTLRLHADRCVRSALVPLLADDLADQVGQGAWLSGAQAGNTRLIVDPSRRLEAPALVEVAVEGTAPRATWTLGARGTRIAHAIVPGPGDLPLLTPEGYLFLPAGSLDRTVQATSVRGTGTLDLGRGFTLAIEGTSRRASPAVENQLWMTSWDGRARLSLHLALFSGDLRVDGFARGAFAGPRSTPYGTLATSDRYDAGVRAQVADVSLFFLLINLESEMAPAADYQSVASGDFLGSGWMTLPLRTYRMGITWRFLD